MRIAASSTALVTLTLLGCGGGGGEGQIEVAPDTAIEISLERAPGSGPRFFSLFANVVGTGLRFVDDRDPGAILVSPGSHVVEATELTSGCEVVGANQQTVSVSFGQTTSISFTITCPESATSNRIVYHTTPEDFFDGRIWTIRPDGTDAREISSGFGQWPSWSPDGSRIAYVGFNGLWIVNHDGTEDRNIVENRRPNNFATWSPTGDELIAIRGNPGAGQQIDLWRINPDGSDIARLTDDPAEENTPAWSPDGAMIAIVKNDELQLLDTNGSFLISLGPANGFGSWPSWSPDGSTLVFAYGESVSSIKQIWSVHVDGSIRTQLTNIEAGCGRPSYSPDGSEIIFHCPDDGDASDDDGLIWRMDADGSNPRIFSEIPGPDVAHADWLGP